MIKCAISSEDMHEVTCHTSLGRLTIPKNSIVNITHSSPEENAALRKKWLMQKKEYKKKLLTQASTVQTDKDGERLVKYRSQWITPEEYATLKKETFTKKQGRLKVEREQHEALLQEKEYKKRKNETIEEIRQGSMRRSREANDILETDEWLMERNAQFTIFYNTGDIASFAKKLKDISSSYYEKAQNDLGLEKAFILNERVEVFLVTDPVMWETLIATVSHVETKRGLANYYKKEIFLDAIDTTKQINNFFAHELSHILIEEFVVQNLSKKHSIPLCIKEGFAHYQGPVATYILPKEKLKKATTSNYYIQFDKLLAISTYPQESLQQELFHTEAASLIEFFFSRYDGKKFNEFLIEFAKTFHRLAPRHDTVTPEITREIMYATIQDSFLRKDFAGYASFEEAWLRYAIKE